jgi:hypothetical protein
MKKCINCNEEKDLDRFDNRKKSKDGYRNQCKECLYKKSILRKNSLSEEKKEEKRIERNKRNRNYRNKRSAESKLKEKQRRRKNHLKRLEKDPLYRLRISYLRRLNKSIKRFNIRDIKFLDNLGCTLEVLKLHIESKFDNWMNWENYGLYNGQLNYGWDIDHIIPISNARSEEEFFKLFHYTNLQPLCSKVNRDIKKDKIENPQ